jgi:hypothetical protein
MILNNKDFSNLFINFFFIKELIELCCNANIGASSMEIIVCILVFCDDICLLSGSIEEMQSLLNLCFEEFAMKCKYIVFGKKNFKT